MTFWNGLSRRSRHLLLLSFPLLSDLIATVIIGYGMVIPGSCIAGLNEYTVGFATSILGVIATYITGVVVARCASAEPYKLFRSRA
jgi:hypothetical protein